MSYQLPPIARFGSLLREEQRNVLGQLFEPCETLSLFILERVGDYSSYNELIESVRKDLLVFLRESEDKYNKGEPFNDDISKIIAAHPRLGAPKPGSTLSQHSASEQKSLGGSQQEALKLAQLNEKYEKTFPGLRYVVFVNGRPRTEVMLDMENRINRGDIKLERIEAMNAMCDIALDRANKLQPRL